MVASVVSAVTPLCPAGHLPLKGGDRIAVGASVRSKLEFVGEIALRWDHGAGSLSISPLEGEMPGRAEGGDPASIAAESPIA
jgi:hypothetical protein